MHSYMQSTMTEKDVRNTVGQISNVQPEASGEWAIGEEAAGGGGVRERRQAGEDLLTAYRSPVETVGKLLAAHTNCRSLDEPADSMS